MALYHIQIERRAPVGLFSRDPLLTVVEGGQVVQLKAAAAPANGDAVVVGKFVAATVNSLTGLADDSDTGSKYLGATGAMRGNTGIFGNVLGPTTAGVPSGPSSTVPSNKVTVHTLPGIYATDMFARDDVSFTGYAATMGAALGNGGGALVTAAGALTAQALPGAALDINDTDGILIGASAGAGNTAGGGFVLGMIRGGDNGQVGFGELLDSLVQPLPKGVVHLLFQFKA